ncbi:MAG: hypothetical protein WAS07_07470 [Micropruina sp.]
MDGGHQPTSISRSTTVDFLGGVALAALTTWVMLVTLVLRGTDPGLGAVLVTAGSLAAGTVAGRGLHRSASSQAIDLALVGAVGVLVLGPLYRGGAGAWPLSYANANAALAVQLTALAGLRSFNASGWRRAGLVGLAVLAYGQTVLSQSVIGSGVGAGVLLLVLWPALGRLLGRVTPFLGGVIVLGASAVNAGVAADLAWAGRASRWFDETRRELWAAAYELWRGSPWVGNGAGAFSEATPIPDADTMMAHSGLLQMAAEAGLVGIGLLALVVGAGYVLAARPGGSAAALVAMAWTALCVHALFDHVQDFAWVMIAAGGLLGLASAGELRKR